jgi:hypothetical protein
LPTSNFEMGLEKLGITEPSLISSEQISGAWSKKSGYWGFTGRTPGNLFTKARLRRPNYCRQRVQKETHYACQWFILRLLTNAYFNIYVSVTWNKNDCVNEKFWKNL